MFIFQCKTVQEALSQRLRVNTPGSNSNKDTVLSLLWAHRHGTVKERCLGTFILENSIPSYYIFRIEREVIWKTVTQSMRLNHMPWFNH